MSYSHSILSMYEQCPKKYRELKVLKSFKETRGPEAAEGDAIHKAIEDFISKRKAHAPYEIVWGTILEAVSLMGHSGVYEIEPEYKLSIGKNLATSAWDNSWLRGIIDFLVISGDRSIGFIADWKTGKIRPNMAQLDFYALLTFLTFQNMQHIFARFVWVKYAKTTRTEYRREDILGLATKVINRVTYLETETEWRPRPSGLCRNHCPITTCPHNGNYTRVQPYVGTMCKETDFESAKVS